MKNKQFIIKIFCISIASAFITQALAKNYILTPDQRTVAIKGGFSQPDLSQYRSSIDSKIIDRTFYTNEATFMANEGYKTGMEGYNDMVKASFPIAYKRAFQWVTAREMYFYARYLLDYIGGRSHSGVHMVHGPYFSMKADKHSQFNKLVRDRGERQFSNKDILLGMDLPLVYQRTGFPRVFDDIQPTYLQYKSVQPFFTGQLDNTDSFDDPISGKKGGWGVPNTYFNDLPQRFDHGDMDTTFNLGAMGQFVKRRSQWLDRFFQANHRGTTHISKHKEVPLLGNDAEEGMRGWGLTMSALNAMLQVKSSMFTDGEKLIGVNTDTYDPKNGFKYLPHEIKPNLLWVGDIPERVWAMDIQDPSSQLWDQASWVWATSAYAVAANRRGDFFTDNPPVDGGLVEKRTGLLAESIGNAVFSNIQAMHTDNNILVSQWHPEEGKGSTITLKDMAMALVAINDMAQSWQNMARKPELVQQAKTLLVNNADFLVKVQNPNGSFNSSYSTSGQAQGKNGLAVSQFEGIRALIAAYYSSRDDKYLTAARKAYNHVNRDYWQVKDGVYRSELNNDIATVTPYSVGVTMAALREVMFTTPSYLLEDQVEHMTRWWIQTVNQSGLLLSEHQSTGEVFTGYGTGDDDADGIPYVSKAHGEYGAAPVMAAVVKINLGSASNAAFNAIEGDTYQGDNLDHVAMNFSLAQHPSLKHAPQLALTNQGVEGLVNRSDLVRTDGSHIPLQPSKPILIGKGTQHDLSGKQIFEANCMLCHGQNGEGIDGKPLKNFMGYPAATMEAFVFSGNPTASMPAFGIGNNDKVGGTLTKDEIKRVVSYVQSNSFKHNYAESQKGHIIKGFQAKDIWFYLSRYNVQHQGEKMIDASIAQQYIEQMQNPAKVKATQYENIQRSKPDAEVTQADMPQ